MVGTYVKFGYGPWFADDDHDIRADGVFQGPDFIAHQTLDGVGRPAKSIALDEERPFYMVTRIDGLITR